MRLLATSLSLLAAVAAVCTTVPAAAPVDGAKVAWNLSVWGPPRAFTAGIALHELSPHTGSLEELFLTWTADPSSEDVKRP